VHVEGVHGERGAGLPGKSGLDTRGQASGRPQDRAGDVPDGAATSADLKEGRSELVESQVVGAAQFYRLAAQVWVSGRPGDEGGDVGGAAALFG
jgi:hypothetical protein